ncbi:MAG: YqgE/AlgH family protein [Nitrospirales bacterium]|nr:YqgE/AlgH family protein [Nitrospiraceae bacterium]MDR4487755.1 YqgE/AlgH family protein [Nitrospirales bacterium]
MNTPLGKGVFLIAKPALRDPNFCQTVVLLCEHGPEGALGVVVNRPTEMNITEVLPQVPVIEGQPHRVFSGGPVQKNSLLILYRLPQEIEGTHPVLDGVYLGGNMEALERILEGPAVDETFRAFMGYSGWAPGQLENEMKMGSWLTMPANPDLVFNPDATQLWTDVIQQFGDEYSIYSDMPPDPSLN